jgi:hypothetical protein
MANRKVTAAASQYWPMMTAPIAATETSRSIPMTLAIRVLAAAITMLVPATTAAATMTTLPAMLLPGSWSSIRAMTMSNPERTGIAHRLLIHLRNAFMKCLFCGSKGAVLLVQPRLEGGDL